VPLSPRNPPNNDVYGFAVFGVLALIGAIAFALSVAWVNTIQDKTQHATVYPAIVMLILALVALLIWLVT